MESTYENLVSIEGLYNKRFFIPAYQRGYRWGKQEVSDLLNDIKEFLESPREQGKSFYCLQPLVVKRLEEGVYKVLDGQQRLSTILLILNHRAQRDSSKKGQLYEIEYETRPRSQEFLTMNLEDMRAHFEDSIDFYHLYGAAGVIDRWYRDLESEQRIRFDEDFVQYTKFIWHEIEKQDDEIDAFTRLNQGKIALTNDELVKSLFLNRSNFQGISENQLRLQQLEIAQAWDHIVYSLKNDEFWNFLSPRKQYGQDNRIEYILDLISEKKDASQDDNFTFRYFYEIFKAQKGGAKDGFIKDQWQRIKSCFQTLEDWFNDKKYYHYIGYLLAVGHDIRDLLEKWGRERRAFHQHIRELIIGRAGGEATLKDVSQLSYGESPKALIRNVLLLHNVLIYSQVTNELSRFSFCAYHAEKWDIEHIHARADSLDKEKSREAWLDATRSYVLDEALKEQMSQYDPSTFHDVYDRVVMLLGDSNDGLGNLCLLDSSTNRSYGCAVYADKRSTILQKFAQGQFIPLGTVFVFNKFFSDRTQNMLIWDEGAQRDYSHHIQETINQFLTSQH